MSLFEFISGMISVLIALAVAQLLVSVGRLAQAHRRVQTYLPHTLWSIILFLIAFLHWWSLWDFRDLEWNSAMFFYSLVGPLLVFFAVTVLNPDTQQAGDIDLEAHFQGVRRLFLGVYLAALIFLTLDGPLFGTEPPWNSLRFTQVTSMACILVALLTPRTWVQALMAAIILGVMLSATAIRFLPGNLG